MSRIYKRAASIQQAFKYIDAIKTLGAKDSDIRVTLRGTWKDEHGDLVFGMGETVLEMYDGRDSTYLAPARYSARRFLKFPITVHYEGYERRIQPWEHGDDSELTIEAEV